MLENAREFLARVLPWPEPGEPGYINAHWSYQKPDVAKPLWAGRAATGVDKLINDIQYNLNRPDTRGMYVCMSRQTTVEQVKTARGYPQLKAVRAAANATHFKALWLDIDVKPGAYATIEDAFTALYDFIGKVGLPRPTMVVNTGGGIHVYWVVDRALTFEEWQPYAFALAEATKIHGLICDTQCTVDAARILRVPGTLNMKTEPPRHVFLYSDYLDYPYSYNVLTAPLEPLKGAIRVPTNHAQFGLGVLPRRDAIVADNALAMGLVDKDFRVDVLSVARECGFLFDAARTGGADLANPLWNLTTLIAAFDKKDGRSLAHIFGRQHHGYTKESTDEFYDRKLREVEDKGLGWPSCATISSTGAKQCATCVHFGKGKSPLNFEPRASGATHDQAAQAQPSPANANAPNAAQVQGASDPATAAGGHTYAQLASAAAGTGQAGTGGGLSALLANQIGPLAKDLPEGFKREADGLIYKGLSDEGGNTRYVAISEYPMFDGWISTGPLTLHFNSVVEKGKVSQLDLPLEVVGTNDMRKHLQNQGFMLAVKNDSAGEFFVSWIKKLQQAKATVASSPFGWQDKGGNTEGFVYGGYLWSPTGFHPAAAADGIVAKQYKPVGQAQHWLDAAKLVTGVGRPDLEAIVASSFAAPLVRFTGHNGMLMSAYSKESGVGKSTALRIAQAVWGDPVKAIQSLSDTQNSVMGKVGEVRSLPIYWDELKTDEDTKKFVNITFQLSQGKEKSRMTQAARQREAGTWQTLVVSASNDSLLDHVTAQTSTTLAGLYRIFEYKVSPPAVNAPGIIDTSKATITLAKLNNNYGEVGLKYAQFLGQHFSTIEKDIEVLSYNLNVETKSTQDERFWISLMATILLGARYANHLGFSVFDEVALKDFMMKSLAGMREQRRRQTVDMTDVVNISAIMSSFWGDMRKEHTVITNRIHVSQGKPPKTGVGAIQLRMDPSQEASLKGVIVHYGLEDKLLRISSSQFGEWCKKKNKSRHIIVEALKEKVSMRSVVGRLAGGTKYATATEHLMEIDLSSSKELDFIDES